MLIPRPDLASLRAFTAGLIFVAFCVSVASAAPPPGFTRESVLSGLAQPMQLTFLPDGRILIIGKTGQLWIADPSLPTPVAVPYMTLTDLNDGGERGLTSIALDPDFATNNHFYLYFAKESTQRNQISRFTHLGNSASLASEMVIWEDNEDFSSCCHYGGAMGFGPDGLLYLATGEEFNGGQAQDLTRAGGKLIRLAKDGTIPPGPFAGPPGNLPEIFGYGLRNPFRGSWDLQTNRFFIGEVGGNNQAISWEDVHIGRERANYGWPLCEGPCDNPDFPACDCALHDDPVFAYPHLSVGASLTGGFVYRRSQFSPLYRSAYFYGDFQRGQLHYVLFDEALNATGSYLFDPLAGGVVALEQSPDGALYEVDISGTVWRYSFATPSACESQELLLDGLDDWVNIPNLSFPGDFTVEAWVYLESPINNGDAIMGQDGGTGQDINFFLSRARLFAPGDVIIANTEISPQTWTHVAITRQGSALTLYLDGVEDAVGNWSGTLTPQALGRGNAGFTQGRLEEVRFWDLARSGAQIAANLSVPVGGDTPGLVAYYKFNEDSLLQEAFNATGADKGGFRGADPTAQADDPLRGPASSPLGLSRDCPLCPCRDVDRSGRIDILDAVRLQRQLGNLDPDLPEADLCAEPDVAALRTDLSLQGPSVCSL